MLWNAKKKQEKKFTEIRTLYNYTENYNCKVSFLPNIKRGIRANYGTGSPFFYASVCGGKAAAFSM